MFQKSFSNDFLKLSKLQIIFKKPEEAAKFLNKNYTKIDKWWENNLKSKIYKNFKQKYIPKKLQIKDFIRQV